MDYCCTEKTFNFKYLKKFVQKSLSEKSKNKIKKNQNV